MLRLRVDDFPGTKPEEFYRHNLENYKKFHSTLMDGGVREYVLGAIPVYTRDHDLEWMSSQPGLTVAMHGVVHDESRQDEFEGLLHPDIRSILLIHLDRMSGLLGAPVTDYVPPHNAFGRETTRALADIGFRNIYGGPGTDLNVELDGLEMRYSEAPLEYGRSDELSRRGSVEYLRSEALHSDVWLTLHWTWEWNIGLDNLRAYLSEISGLFRV